MGEALRRQTCFAGRPLGLHKCLVEILERRDGLTAGQLAAVAYRRRRGRLIVDPAHCLEASIAQITSTRRALRRLVDGGRVQVVGRCRRHRLFALTPGSGRPAELSCQLVELDTGDLVATAATAILVTEKPVRIE